VKLPDGPQNSWSRSTSTASSIASSEGSARSLPDKLRKARAFQLGPAFIKILGLITEIVLLSVAISLLSISEGFILFSHLEDHGFPLVQLKGQRRDLVAAMMGNQRPVASRMIMQIAAIQQTIAAIEEVVTDLDAEIVDHAGKGGRPDVVCHTIENARGSFGIHR
jgi:hypothetical protein